MHEPSFFYTNSTPPKLKGDNWLLCCCVNRSGQVVDPCSTKVSCCSKVVVALQPTAPLEAASWGALTACGLPGSGGPFVGAVWRQSWPGGCSANQNGCGTGRCWDGRGAHGIGHPGPVPACPCAQAGQRLGGAGCFWSRLWSVWQMTKLPGDTDLGPEQLPISSSVRWEEMAGLPPVTAPARKYLLLQQLEIVTD